MTAGSGLTVSRISITVLLGGSQGAWIRKQIMGKVDEGFSPREESLHANGKKAIGNDLQAG
jgi:hypothetical protein